MMKATKAFRNTMKIVIFLICFYGVFPFSLAADCNQDHVISAEEYRELILSSKIQRLSNFINFPLEAVVGSKKVIIRDENHLEVLWSLVLTDRFLSLIKGSSACDLAREMQLSSDENRIGSLAIYYNESFSEYRSSGITSSKQLYSFLDQAIQYSSSKDYYGMSKLFKYPFSVIAKDKYIVVTDAQAFLKKSNFIIDERFVKILRNALDEKEFYQHSMGVRLNQEADIWVVEVNGKLFLQPVEIAPDR